jgi:transcriptional regulator with XRE-family HTH domain
MQMATVVSGINGEYRQLTLAEIALMVKALRKLRGFKQSALAAQACVVERTLERLETGKSVSAQTYERVAAALQLDPALFTSEIFVPNPAGAVAWHAKQAEERDRTHVKVSVLSVGDPRQIRELFGRHSLWFDDSRVKPEHLARVAKAHELLADYCDIASELPETDKLRAAREVLGEIREIEALGYCVKIGCIEDYKMCGLSDWSMGIVVIFPRSKNSGQAAPDEVYVRREMTVK